MSICWYDGSYMPRRGLKYILYANGDVYENGRYIRTLESRFVDWIFQHYYSLANAKKRLDRLCEDDKFLEAEYEKSGESELQSGGELRRGCFRRAL